MCSSEQYSHPQIDLTCGCVVVINRERLQMAIFQREQEIGSRPVNYVAEHALVARERRITVTLRIGERAYIGRERVVLPKRKVELKLGGWMVFQLCPASHGVERKHCGVGIDKRSVVQHATPNPAA